MPTRRERRQAEHEAAVAVAIERDQALEADKINRITYLKVVKRGEPGVVFQDRIPSRFCLRPGAIPVGRSVRKAELAWRLEDLSITASAAMWKRNGWRVRDGESPTGQRSGQVGGAVQKTWDVFGEWQVDRVREDATTPWTDVVQARKERQEARALELKNRKRTVAGTDERAEMLLAAEARLRLK
jgi:hypothetical protein